MNFKVSIDQNSVFVNSNMSILQACEVINITIPRFCYHDRLSIAGNCRMCLVEIENAPKLIASCASPVMANMVIYTKSLAVKKAREGVLEFLLLNHPLDCAICDQAGECDLQDQSMFFGSDRSRFQEYKRAVEDIISGPLIKTIMSRCIHCTRCVRFANEITGIPELGSSGRGNSLAINLYINKLFKSEFSGNLIDLCPVGALTSKPYTFVARPWELKSIESVDTLDGVGSNIRIDIRGYEIMRILPRLNESINEEWISDKTRFAFDGLKVQRLYEPLLKKKGSFVIITWQEALKEILLQLSLVTDPYCFGVHIGPQTDVESLFLLKYLVEKKQGVFLNVEKSRLDFRSCYLFNSQIYKLEESDVCLLVGVNPRLEASIINLRLRKRYVVGGFKVASFGSALNTTFPIYNLGSTLSSFIGLLEGRHSFCQHFSNAKKPTVIIGRSFFQRLSEKKVGLLIDLLVKNTGLIHRDWYGVNFLHQNASDVGKFELGINKKVTAFLNMKLIYCIGESNYKRLSESLFIIYQGHQGNDLATFSNLVLPGASFVEKTATFVNVEGRYQKTKAALCAPGNAKEDWRILYVLIEKLLSMELKKEKVFELKRELFNAIHYTASNIGYLQTVNQANQSFLLRSKIIIKNGFLPASNLDNFYRSDTISRLSTIMVNCTKNLLEKGPFSK